jgi:uncharacterized glyoxalase superfamily protein PhnB
MPENVIVPVLSYPSVSEAVAWLESAFGFRLRWQVADHRAQLAVNGSAAVAVVKGDPASDTADHIMIRVDDVDAHRRRVEAAGGAVTEATDHPYGERQYTAVDFSGRSWVFTQTIADKSPDEWGARLGEPS